MRLYGLRGVGIKRPAHRKLNGPLREARCGHQSISASLQLHPTAYSTVKVGALSLAQRAGILVRHPTRERHRPTHDTLHLESNADERSNRSIIIHGTGLIGGYVITGIYAEPQLLPNPILRAGTELDSDVKHGGLI